VTRIKRPAPTALQAMMVITHLGRAELSAGHHEGDREGVGEAGMGK